tara:strand:- start:7129 stop:7299 length:171 start_codon:yes stop_codon:yes gene_type:complete
MNEMQERMCSFMGGGILNILVIPTSQIIEVFILGFVGGLAGIFARELFFFIKSKIW